MRITENKIAQLIKELNDLESKVHPIDSARYVNGRMWSYNYFGAEGYYLNRGINNPLYDLTNRRVSARVAYAYLLGVKNTLAYNLAYGLEHS